MKNYLLASLFLLVTNNAFADDIVKEVFGKSIRIPLPAYGKATCENNPEMLRTMQAHFAKRNISSVVTCFHAPVDFRGENEQVFVMLADLQNKERKVMPDEMKNQKELLRTGFSKSLSAMYLAALQRARQTTPYYQKNYDTLVKNVPSFNELYDHPDGYFVYSTEFPLFGELGPDKTVLYITGMMVVKERFITLTSFTTKADQNKHNDLTTRFKEWILRIGKENSS